MKKKSTTGVELETQSIGELGLTTRTHCRAIIRRCLGYWIGLGAVLAVEVVDLIEL